MSVVNNKKIAKNTIVLYFRMIVILVINLYISRLVLKNLGVDDFGIYNVVGGVVVLFSMIGGILSGASSRFITFEIGKERNSQLQTIFSCSVTVQIIMASIATVVLETAGVWFLYNKMQIDPKRIQAAFWCLQFSILTCFVNFISVPYNAVIIAYERMKTFAWISIIECLGKLFIVVLLGYTEYDRLFLYGLLLALLSILIRFVYRSYCYRSFKECRFKIMWKKEVIKEMFFFGLWNFIGSSAAVLRDHGGNILLNIFFGPAVNAARGIAVQVNSATNQFVSNFMIALGPQITKTYASEKINEMHELIFWGAKVSFFLSFFITVPVLINTNFVLHLWLVDVPNHTLWFVRLILLYTLHESFSCSLMTAQNATGKIRNYQLIVGVAILLNFPLSFICLKNGLPAESVFCISIIISILCFFLRLSFLKRSIHLDVKLFIFHVWIRSIFTAFIVLLPISLIYKDIEDSWISLISSCLLCVFFSSISIYFVGCNKSERVLLNSFLRKMKEKVFR